MTESWPAIDCSPGEPSIVGDCIYSVEHYGDAAFCIYVEGPTTEEVWRAAHRAARRLESVKCVFNVVPTYTTVYVEFDQYRDESNVIRDRIERAIGEAGGSVLDDRPARLFTIPVVYGGKRGPDLVRLASSMGMTAREVINAHVDAPLRIRCLAGPIGGPMMSGPGALPEVPRQRSPRPVVRGGSAVLAGKQAFLKTMDGPSGWQVIGATPLTLIDIGDPRLVPWAPNDCIQFVQVTESEWPRLAGGRPECRDL